MAVEFVLFAERLFVGAMWVIADEWIDMYVV
jgi:hypothetical protein